MSLDTWSVLAEAVERATPDQCPLLMGHLEQLKASLWLKMTIGTGKNVQAQPDRLLTADEVAIRLNVTKGFIYRNARSYPFMIRQGRYVRFSNNGLELYIRRHQGH